MPDGLKRKNRLLYELITKGFINRSYLAYALYGEERTKSGEKFDVKQTAAKFHQKINDKTNMSDEEILKLYEIIGIEIRQINEVLEKLMPMFELQYENLKLVNEQDDKLKKIGTSKDKKGFIGKGKEVEWEEIDDDK